MKITFRVSPFLVVALTACGLSAGTGPQKTVVRVGDATDRENKSTSKLAKPKDVLPKKNTILPGENHGDDLTNKSTPVSPGALDSLTCSTSTRSALRGRLLRLSRVNYGNTLADLLGSDVLAQPSISSALTKIPSEEVFKSFDLTKNGLTGTHIEAFVNVSLGAGSYLFSDDTRAKAFVSRAQACSVGPSNAAFDACVDGFIEKFGRRAWRRPLTATEKTALRSAYDTEKTGGTRVSAMRTVLAILLTSKDFIYFLEDKGTATADKARKLTSHELATRMSYALTGSTPDDALLAAADSGKLATDAGYKEQVERLASLPAAERNFGRFTEQWFNITTIPLPTADTTYTAEQKAELSKSFHDEVVTLAKEAAFKDKSTVGAFFRTHKVIPASPLHAEIYGMPASATPVVSTNPKRAGILTRAALLADSQAKEPRLVHRGYVVYKGLLCNEVGAIPPNALAEAAKISGALPKGISTREHWSLLTAAPACAGCHTNINPPGFALHEFDSYGQFRTQESVRGENGDRVNVAIDTQVKMVTEPGQAALAANDAAELSAILADSRALPACFAAQYFTYATGGTDRTNCAVKDMWQANNASGGGMLASVKALVLAPEFKSVQWKD